ncbi:MAG TPA: hypothetical protein VGP26_25840 [Actinophytocola sp.]|jgi:hypothetical protein|nr:hypothetical protein [Actinophytocola sp.]
MTDPYRQQRPLGSGPQPNGANQAGPHQTGPQYAGQSYPGAQPAGPADPNAPAMRSGLPQFMALRVLISWLVVMVPIAYGIYMTLIAVPPLFEN